MLFIILQVFLILAQDNSRIQANTRENLNFVFIWWTPFINNFTNVRECDNVVCTFTDNRNIIESINGNHYGILFYGSDFNPEDLPSPSTECQMWALLHEESPKNQPLFSHKSAMNLFNFTATFRQTSDEPLTLQYLKSLNELTSQKEHIGTSKKQDFILEGNAPIVFIQSDCDTPSGRDEYVTELGKYIAIDSYGKCLQNKNLPDDLHDAPATMQHPKLRAIIARYKFALSIENAACTDYITEKLWRPLSLGVVPLYWGAENVHQWLPNNSSIIHLREYTPKQLAAYIEVLLNNDTLYESYLEHKTKQVIENSFLIESYEGREWGIDNEPDKINFIDHFECSVCKALHQQVSQREVRVADESHYGCPEPESVLPHGVSNAHWREEWHRAAIQAEELKRLLETGQYEPNSYQQHMLQHLIQQKHFHRYPPTSHQEL